MRVTAIWRYPVKSVGGEAIDEAVITELGIDGDRRWGIVDDETGNVLTARREPRLLMATARVVDGRPVITIGDNITTAADEIVTTAADLRAWLERPVTLAAAGPAGGVYENPRDPFGETDWTTWRGPGGAWHDSTKSRVSIVSSESLRHWDIRRFRTNIVVDGSDEDALVGRRVGLGDTVLDVAQRIDRCVMVTRPQPGLDRDLDVLKTIHAEHESCLSVGALVVTGGTVRVGDELSAVGDQSPSSAGGGR